LHKEKGDQRLLHGALIRSERETEGEKGSKEGVHKRTSVPRSGSTGRRKRNDHHPRKRAIMKRSGKQGGEKKKKKGEKRYILGKGGKGRSHKKKNSPWVLVRKEDWGRRSGNKRVH